MTTTCHYAQPDAATLTFLRSGRDLLGSGPSGLIGDVAAQRRAWRLHAEQLIAEYASDRGLMGTRPWAFWAFDPAAQRGRQLLPGFTSTSRPGSTRWFGVPFGDDESHYETQRQFLERNGLLTDSEREALESPR